MQGGKVPCTTGTKIEGASLDQVCHTRFANSQGYNAAIFCVAP